MPNKDATVRQYFTWNILCMSSKIVGAFQLKLENNDWELVSLVLQRIGHNVLKILVNVIISTFETQTENLLAFQICI